MLAPEQILVAALASTGLVAGARGIAQAARRGFNRRIAAATGATAAFACAARVLLTRPVLLHANFHGAALVDEILAFPRWATHRAEYGQGSFFVLGALTRIAGGSFERLVLVNQLLGVATLVVLGALAARLSKRPWTAPLLVLLGALDPTSMRVAGSEDAHTLATFLGSTALFGLEAAGRARSRTALVYGASAALLVLWTRQTLYPVAVLALGLALARADRQHRRSLSLAVPLALVGLVLAARVAHTLRHPTDAVTLGFLPIILAHRPASLLAGHPLLDPRVAPVLLPLGLFGLTTLWRQSGGRLLAIGVVGLVLITLPFAFPTPGVELAFRVPAVALWLIPAAIGAERLATGLGQGGGAPALALGLAILPVALPAFGRVRATTAATEEMHALRALAASLPAGTTVVAVPTREPVPAVPVPRFALPASVRVERIDRGDPLAAAPTRFLVVGLQCRARSFMEIVPSATPAQLLARDFRHGLGEGASVPTELRPECRALLAGATLESAVVPIAAPDDPPFAFFGATESPVSVSLWRLAQRRPSGE